MPNLIDDHFDDSEDLFQDRDSGDVFALLGCCRPALILSSEQRVALARVLVSADSCDGTLRVARAWAKQAGVDWSRLRRQLRRAGGFCDCEVVMNVLPDVADRLDGADDADATGPG